MQDDQKRTGRRDSVPARVGISSGMMGAIVAVLAVVVIVVYALGPWGTKTALKGPGTTVGQNTVPIVPSTAPSNSKTTK